MKNKMLKKILTGVVISILGLLCLGMTAEAQEYGYSPESPNRPTESVNVKYCMARDSSYDLGLENVWTYVYLLNRTNTAQRCRSHIDFKTGMETSLVTELLIKGANQSGGYFAFGPRIVGPGDTVQPATLLTSDIYENTRASFSMNSNFTYKTYKDLYKESVLPSDACSIRVKTSKVAVQNIYLNTNNNKVEDKDINGLCFEGDDIVLKNVDIQQIAGSAIVLGEKTNTWRFEGDFNKITGAKIGIEVKGAALGFRDSVDIDNIAMGTATQYFVKTEADAFIDSETLDIMIAGTTPGTRTYTINGKVTSCDTSIGADKKPKDAGCTKDTMLPVSATHVIVYYLHGTGDEKRVYNVGRRELLGGSLNSEGNFIINFSDADIINKLTSKNIANPVVPESAKVFLMADTGEAIGSSSNMFALKKKVSSGNGVDSPVSGNYSDLLFLTPEECNKEAGLLGFNYDFNPDTDGDGIFDIIERLVKKDGTLRKTPSCNCGGDTLICWANTDSDNDGIPDGNEAICKNGKSLKNIQQEIVSDGMIAGTQVCPAAAGSTEIGFRDSDGDGTPDVMELDSDDDGVDDGVEDRARLYEPSRRAYYQYISDGSTTTPFTLENKKVPCSETGIASELYRDDLADLLNYDKNKGIAYGLFIVNQTDQKMTLVTPNSPDVLHMKENLGDKDYSIQALACRNGMLEDATNFNGMLDQAGADRSDLTRADTDGDGYCDGSKTVGVAGAVGACDKTDDNCPRKAVADNECTIDCVKGEMEDIIEDVEGKYIDAKHDNLVMKDGKPVLFDIGYEKGKLHPDALIGICGDYDKDGIPNCVEALVANDGKYNSIGQCPTGASEFPLDPLKADSDGDKLGDGHDSEHPDICPVDETNKCDPYKIYIEFPILAYYLDRDGDGLRDVEEFGSIEELISANGIPDTTKHMDPLNEDTDGDMLNDRVEIKMGTNPLNKDTDGDGLTDFEEVNMDNNSNSLAINIGESYGCKKSSTDFNNDTDPLKKDTDGDGLSDYQEVYYTKTSPNNADSDNDGLCDGTKYAGKDANPICATYYELTKIPTTGDYIRNRFETDPCKQDTDGDKATDKQEFDQAGCGTDPLTTCIGVDREILDNSDIGSAAYGEDSDGDGLPDAQEKLIGTDKNKDDTDGDGSVDGCVNGDGELCNWMSRENFKGSYKKHFNTCTEDFLDCDTDPLVADSDGDGLNDDKERKYTSQGQRTPTNPWNTDTDGDCIPDGPMVLADGTVSVGEDKNKNGVHDSDETRAASEYSDRGGIIAMWAAVDTDGDGLPDGNFTKVTGSEDRNCNGIWDKGENGVATETNPLNVDSDGDGVDDWDETTVGGVWNEANITRAVNGRQGGCSLASNGQADWSMMVIFAGLLALITVIRKRVASKA